MDKVMNIDQLMEHYEGGVWTLQTWTLGKQFLGPVSKISKEGNTLTFERLTTEELVTGWEFRGITRLSVPVTTEFTVDPLGRVTFPMGPLGLATLFPPNIDPKNALGKSS